MAPRRVRLGDKVDDYCPRCRLVMNHGVMALDGEVMLKVQCNTCLNDHPYRHGKAPRKKDPVKAAYDELLSRLPGAGAPSLRGSRLAERSEDELEDDAPKDPAEEK